jgi:hypothetical protein
MFAITLIVSNDTNTARHSREVLGGSVSLATLAHLVEHRSCKADVVGSSPTGGPT